MSADGRESIRARLGQLASHVLPNLDERAWRRARSAQVDRLRSEGAGLAGVLAAETTTVQGAKPHLVVVPMDGPTRDTWCPAGGNFFFEIQQAAREFLPDTAITIFHIEQEEPASSWHPRLAQLLTDVGATHLIAQVESDPERSSLWTWDVLWADLSRVWDGVLLGVVFDSAFRMITLQSRELARISSRWMECSSATDQRSDQSICQSQMPRLHWSMSGSLISPAFMRCRSSVPCIPTGWL
jgi:hypothetical protein